MHALQGDTSANMACLVNGCVADIGTMCQLRPALLHDVTSSDLLASS